MTYRHEFILAGLPRMPNEMTRSWQKRWREASQWKKDVWAMCASNRPLVPVERARVTFLRVSHGTTGPDSDGLAHSFKPVRDGLVQAKVLKDDNPECIEAIYSWERGKRGQGYIKVTIEEIQ